LRSQYYFSVSDKNFKSFRPTIQIDNLNTCNNEEINTETSSKENEFLKQKVDEYNREIVRLNKIIKHTKSQVIIII
jgi:hypothetical protein